MLQILANPAHRNAPLPLLLIAFLLIFPHPIQCGPAAISGLAPTASGTVEDADAEQLHQRHAFSALEPELAENIFNREGAAKNPLRRTTTMPLTDRIDIGHNAGPTNAAAGGQQQRKGIVIGEKLSGTISSSGRQSPPRMPRSIPSRSEYDAINDDFVSEYDALNLDFNLDDDEGAKGAAKELEVPAREFSWQQGEEKAEEFPPKEWWDGEEVEEAKEKKEAEKVPKKEEEAEKRPTLRASKLVEVVAVKEEEVEQKNVPRRRGSPIQQPILVVDLPQRNRIHGKRGHRARRGVRVEGVARLDGWPAGSRPFGSIDREELKIVPRLVPSWPPPSTTTPMATTTTRQTKGPKTNGSIEELARKMPPSPNGGQKKGGGGQLATTQQQLPPRSNKLPAKKQQQFLSTAQEFFRDLPSGRDEPSSVSDDSKRTILLANSQQQQPNPSSQQQIVPSAQLFPSQPAGPPPPSQQQFEGGHQQVHLQPSQFRPFPAGQDPFQPVLNLGSSISADPQTNGMPAAQHVRRPQNHGQASPAGRLLPTGFVHIATLEAPPQRDEKNQILIDGKRFWVERTVPLSQFYPPNNKPSEPEQSQGKEGKEPAEELPTLLEMPHLQEPPPQQQTTAENGNPTQDPSPSGVNKSPSPPAQSSVRGPRIANSARVFSLADNEPPLWTGQQIGGGGSGDFGGGISPNGGRSGKRRGIGGKAGNNLLALNLGTALSQIFGNFTIEHDAKLVERKPEPTELQQFAEGMPPPPLDMVAGAKRGNEASSEPHRLTRFFERPQRPLHGN